MYQHTDSDQLQGAQTELHVKLYLLSGVCNAKAEECTTSYMCQKILTWVGYMETSLLKIDPPK